MYGVPENLDLRPFLGDHLAQLALGPNDLQLRFGAGGVISVEGRWELRDAAGTLLDQAVEGPAVRECYRLHRLLMATVTGTRTDPPRSFTLVFDNGMTFTVYDDDDNYETCSIQPGDIII
jgi:hypothetical protein